MAHNSNECKIENCMRDECIQKRVRERVQNRDATAAAYVQRRGGQSGTISVSEAMRARGPSGNV